MFPVDQDISCYLESVNNKQDDQEIFRDEHFFAK